MQHAFLVAHDNFRCLEFQQALEPVVAVDHPAIQVVQVRGGKTPAIQRHQRTQLRRQHRQHFHDHPVGLDAGFLEAFQHLQPFGEFLDLGFGVGAFEFLAQRIDFLVQIQMAQQFAHAFGAHRGMEFVAEFLDLFQIGILGQQVAALHRRHARIGHHEGLEIQHALDIAQRHVKHHAQPARQTLQEPDVRHRARQFDMAHALAAHLGQRDFDAAFLADHAAMLETFVFAAQTLVILHRPENLGAEQAIALRLEGAVIDGLGLFYFAIGPGSDLVRGSQSDLDGIELFFLRHLLEQIEQCFHSELLKL